MTSTIYFGPIWPERIIQLRCSYQTLVSLFKSDSLWSLLNSLKKKIDSLFFWVTFKKKLWLNKSDRGHP